MSLHVPLIIRIPGLTDEGKETPQMTEMVDIFPTLVEAAGLLPLPLCPEDATRIHLCREGSSLMPLIKDPSANGKLPPPHRLILAVSPTLYTLRTSRYRYTEFTRKNETLTPLFKISKNPFAIELYDQDLDPLETTNYAGLEEYKDV